MKRRRKVGKIGRGRGRLKKRKPPNTLLHITVMRVFFVFFFLLIVANVLSSNRETSARENRVLAQGPEFSLVSVASGTYMSQFEKFLSDQFVGRDFFRGLSVDFKRIGGSRMENDVFLGRNNQLMQDIVSPNQDELQVNIEAIRSFAKRYPNINHSMMLVPDAATVLSDRLPSFAVVSDQTRQMNHVGRELEDYLAWIDVMIPLRNYADEGVFFQTDHHWTSLGAFIAFQEAAGTLGIAGDFNSAFMAFPVTNTFNGTLASRSGFAQNVREDIYVYVPRGDDELIVNFVDEQRRSTSLFDSSKLETYDQYGVFLGGNTSVISIRTTAPDNRRLLIVKDSFANSFVQFLTPYFREIILVDPRYYQGHIDEIMSTYRITDSLILYSGNTFFQDNNLSGVLGGEE
ncbi:MAG: DHHW family protein [Lachnospiraceae bacterium]|nr:DHHW family protein [Lachnospiraceae bacterium]